jgi:hypothetical protein
MTLGVRRDLAGLDTDIQQALGRVIQQAFKYGIDSDLIQGGLLAEGSEQTILEESATQNYKIGTRLQTRDGRVFRYCKAGADLTSSINGCVNDNKPYEGDRPATSYLVGDTEITIPSESTSNAVENAAANAYQNGYIWFQMSPHMFHLIASNTAKSGTTQVLTLDKGLLYALPASASGADTMWVTIWPSIYGNVKPASGGMRSVVCKPLIQVTSGYYFWGQTWGPAFFQAGGTAPGRTANYRTTVFQTDGSVLDASDGAVGHQRAGYILSQTTSSDGDQLVMLRLAP